MVRVATQDVSADKALSLAELTKAEAAATAAQLVQCTAWLPMTFSGVDPAGGADAFLEDNDKV